MSEKANKVLHIICLVIFSIIVLVRVVNTNYHVTIIGFILSLLALALLLPPSLIKFYPEKKILRNIFIKMPLVIFIIVIAFSYFTYHNPSFSIFFEDSEHGTIGEDFNVEFVKKSPATMTLSPIWGKLKNAKINNEAVQLNPKGQTEIKLQPGKNTFKIEWEAFRSEDNELSKGEETIVCYFKSADMIAKEAAEQAKAEREEYAATHTSDSPYQVYVNTDNFAGGNLTATQIEGNMNYYDGRYINNWKLLVNDVYGDNKLSSIHFSAAGAENWFTVSSSDVTNWVSLKIVNLRKGSQVSIKQAKLSKGFTSFNLREVEFY